MRAHQKPPSLLWAEADEVARTSLIALVIELHRRWQDGPHFVAWSKVNRTPKAAVHWATQEDTTHVTYALAGEGVNEHLVATLDLEHPAFLLLSNQPLIRLLDVWLSVSSENGFDTDEFLTRADALDFRRHLAPFDAHPAEIRWALVELYQLLFEFDASLAELGSETWGFWLIEESNFEPLAAAAGSNSRFGELDEFLDSINSAAAFGAKCGTGRYDFSFAGWAEYCSQSDNLYALNYKGATFGQLGMYFLNQPRETILFQFGAAFKALNAFESVTFEQGLATSANGAGVIVASRSSYYRINDLARDLIDIGRRLEQLKFRIFEERRAMLARKFERSRKNRTLAATKANKLDRRLREEAILQTITAFDEGDFLTASTERLNFAKLARAVAEVQTFRSTKSSLGLRGITRVLRSRQRDLRFKSQKNP